MDSIDNSNESDQIDEDGEDTTTCALCDSEVPTTEIRHLNDAPACNNCIEQVKRDIALQHPGVQDFPLAIAGGLGGALVSAGIWALIVVLTNYEVGYVALLVGFLAGWGVKLGARGKLGMPLQITAAAMSVVGLLLAKYFIFAHFFVQAVKSKLAIAEISYFSSMIIETFFGNFGEMLSGFDLLWLILAIGAAYQVPKATAVKVE